jgi:hypothetical protein
VTLSNANTSEKDATMNSSHGSFGCELFSIIAMNEKVSDSINSASWALQSA